MNARLDETTSTTDPVVRGIVVVTLAITIVGVLALAVLASALRRQDYETALNLLAGGLIDANSLVTHRFGLADAVEALRARHPSRTSRCGSA